MRYLLSEPYALRSWRGVPGAYYTRGFPYARGLSRQEFETLLRCDGAHDLAPTATLAALQRRGMIHLAGAGEQLSPWQRYRACDNLYFPQLNWMITGRCNYNCRHCFNASDNERLATQWQLDEALRLLNEATACGIHTLTITGGEPLLHPHFMDIARAVHERDMSIRELNTNGHFVTPKLLDEMASFGCTPIFKISFDGLGHHDWMRRHPGAESQTLAAMQLCLDHELQVMAQVNVHRGNAEALLPTLELLDKMGVQRTRIIRTSEGPRWLQQAPDLTLTVREYYDLMLETMRTYAASPHQMVVRMWQFAELFPQIGAYDVYIVRCREGEYTDDQPVCLSNRRMVAITSSGEVVPCMQMSGHFELHGISHGNVHTHGLQALLQEGSYLDVVCATTGDLRRRNAECAACPYFAYCCGGCRALGGMSDYPFGSDWAKCLFFSQGYYRKIAEALSGWDNLRPVGALLEDIQGKPSAG